MGVNDVLQPRSMTNPLLYVAAKRVVAAAGVATDKAASLFPVDQLETNACAAASALGFGAEGIGTDVVVES
jgi:hypothetical protein